MSKNSCKSCSMFLASCSSHLSGISFLSYYSIFLFFILRKHALLVSRNQFYKERTNERAVSWNKPDETFSIWEKKKRKIRKNKKKVEFFFLLDSPFYTILLRFAFIYYYLLIFYFIHHPTFFLDLSLSKSIFFTFNQKKKMIWLWRGH